MPFRRARATTDDLEHYEDPVEAEPPAEAITKKEQRKLAKLRKKAQRAAVKAARESEKAREAARKVREAGGAPLDARDKATQQGPDVPAVAAGKDRAAVLPAKEQRRLKKLRRKAQKSH